MKKWCIIDSAGSDEWIQAFDSKDEALAAAEVEWSCLSDHDKGRRSSYLVGLANVEPSSGFLSTGWTYAEDPETGEIDSDNYEVAKQFKR